MQSCLSLRDFYWAGEVTYWTNSECFPWSNAREIFSIIEILHQKKCVWIIGIGPCSLINVGSDILFIYLFIHLFIFASERWLFRVLFCYMGQTVPDLILSDSVNQSKFKSANCICLTVEKYMQRICIGHNDSDHQKVSIRFLQLSCILTVIILVCGIFDKTLESQTNK